MINLPTPYGVIAKAAAVVAVIGGLWWANQHYVVNPAVDRANSAWQDKWDARDLADKSAALDKEKTNRAKEQSLQQQADEQQRQADAEKQRMADSLAASRAAASRLQSGVQSAIDALNAGSAVTSTTASRAAGASAGVLLAELFRSVDEATDRYAAEADRARAAGLRCENIYNAARTSAQQKAP